MKIIGFSKIGNEIKMVLKCDSSLLVNRKPFFLPDWSSDVRMTPCVVLRVCKLGKNIAPRFAHRYFDSIAPGLNIQAADWLAKGDSVRGWAFDYSLPMGSFVETAHWPSANTIISYEEAIQRASEVMTLRQGDLIFIDREDEERPLVKEEVITYELNNNELLYCKIK